MIEMAKQKGAFSEKQMEKSIENVSALLECIKETNPEKYWHFMREQTGILYNGHYNHDFADYDVSRMFCTGKDGKKYEGMYWTAEQVEELTSKYSFPQGTNKWDKFVAFNAAFHDWCKSYEAEDIIRIGYDFYFADDDYSGNKIWDYMQMVHSHSK